MEVEVTFLTRRGSDVRRRPQRASANRIRLGRGTDNEVPLRDIRVELRAAALIQRDDNRLAIDRLGVAPLWVNGESVESALVNPGDEILLGPYRIEVVPPPDGCDGAITVELVQPLGAALERLNAAARIGLDHTSASKRWIAWSGSLVIVAIFLAAPIVLYSTGKFPEWPSAKTSTGTAGVIGLSWNAGEMSNAHRFFTASCQTCHQGAFSRVADASCLSCHATVGGHLKAAADVGTLRSDLAGRRCADCHTEHRGLRNMVVRNAGLCLDCHRDLAEAAPAAGVRDVSGYPDGHPQFRATLVADAAQAQTIRAELGTSPPPIDHPGLKFSHAAHLVPGGFPALHYPAMACKDCHVAEPSGQGFLPITYKNQCQHCHELAFDKTDLPWQDAKVPHGDETAVVAAVWNFYAAKALQSGIASPAAPATERRGAGMPASAQAAIPSAAQAWIADKSLSALNLIFDDKRGCTYCHYGTGPDGAVDAAKMLAPLVQGTGAPPRAIGPVSLRARFLPNAVFDHAKHRGMACEACHDSRQAQSSSVVLIPGIENCSKCHGGETAGLRARSTCITCHDFHRSEFGPMHASGMVQ
jgi:predicted CXXCH cytochrome family protein